jgi:ribosomal protein L13E
MTLVRTRTKSKSIVRKARGFSLSELNEAKVSLQTAKKLKLMVDCRRKSSYPENVEELKRHA